MAQEAGADESHALEARVEELESRVEELESQVESQKTVIDFLAADADISVVTAECPECGNGTLERRSGLSWSKLTCSNCETEWTL